MYVCMYMQGRSCLLHLAGELMHTYILTHTSESVYHHASSEYYTVAIHTVINMLGVVAGGLCIEGTLIVAAN